MMTTETDDFSFVLFHDSNTFEMFCFFFVSSAGVISLCTPTGSSMSRAKCGKWRYEMECRCARQNRLSSFHTFVLCSFLLFCFFPKGKERLTCLQLHFNTCMSLPLFIKLFKGPVDFVKGLNLLLNIFSKEWAINLISMQVIYQGRQLDNNS